MSEVLTNSAMGMTTALRAFVFMHIKNGVTNLMEGGTKAVPAKPYWKCDIADLFYYFAAFQIVACVVIFIYLMETKGVKDKKNICNPVK
jgi:Mg2+/citrate symporter